MQKERVTIAKTLDAVNQRFYQHHGNGFDRTRQAAWPGWLDVFGGTLSPPYNQVLDIGCGNGRFASFLAAHEHLSRQIESYVGYDRDQGLLESARRKTLPFSTKWQTWDWMQSKSSTELIKSDLIVAFGVFHHIFGYEHRLQLLTRLTKSLLWPFEIQAKRMFIVTFCISFFPDFCCCMLLAFRRKHGEVEP